MAYIGMRKPVAALVSSHTDGSAISYAAGFVIGEAVAANVNFETSNDADYGDDIVIDTDNGITGYSGDMDVSMVSATVRAALLGWDATLNTATPAVAQFYSVTDDETPEVGFGFIQVGIHKGTKSYEAYWFHKARFSQNNINASTRKKAIEWNHPKLNFVGEGAYIDNTGKAKYFDWMTFDSETAAWTWLKARASIT